MAKSITWALMDENISIRWVETDNDGTTTDTWRLYKLPDSDPDELAAAYRQLTGNEPHLRIADDPRTAAPTPEPASPEARRHQAATVETSPEARRHQAATVESAS